MAMFGEYDVVVAEQLIDGVDVVVRLGTGYLESKPPPASEGDGVAGDA